MANEEARRHFALAESDSNRWSAFYWRRAAGVAQQPFWFHCVIRGSRDRRVDFL